MEERIIGENKTVNQIFRYISDERKVALQEYSVLSLGREYKEFSTVEEIIFFTKDREEINYNDNEFLKEYSGYNYKHINNTLRNRWNYEENGNIEARPRFLEDGRRLSQIIRRNSTSLGNFKAFRGVDISYFREYGIEKLEDLQQMEGKFLYDSGFVSTSLLESESFFKKENELGINYNIQITYLIPEEFDDGIYLEGDMTYSPNQREYLINNANLARISSVTINEDGTAHLTAVMIPKKIYDEYYEKVDNKQI